MDKTIEELFEEKIKVVLNLIRTNNKDDEALKYTQALRNIVDAANAAGVDILKTGKATATKRQGASAS